MIVDTSAVLRALFWEEGGWQRATLSRLHEKAAVRRTTVTGVLDTGAKRQMVYDAPFECPQREQPYEPAW